MLHGEPTHTVTLDNLTEEEAQVEMEVKWCSLDRLVQGDEIVYPALLPYLLPAIIAAATRYGPAS